MHHGVRRMFADTTAPHLTSLAPNPMTRQPMVVDYVETANVTSTSPFLTLTALLEDRSHPIPACEKEKRKLSTAFGDYEDDDEDEWTSEIVDDADDDSKSSRNDGDAKSTRPSNHSEIEKRRRDKMNNFITEIAKMVPSCAGLSRRMDKLSVLRLAVQHIKSLKGTFNLGGHETYKPVYVSDDELKELIMQRLDAFMLAISCDDMKIFHVSDNVQDVMGHSSEDLIGQNFFCLLHPDDLEIVKNQISWQIRSDPNQNGKDRILGAADWSILTPGSKRSFFCRLRAKTVHSSAESLKPESNPHFDQILRTRSYHTVHCDGFVKFCESEPPRGSEISKDADGSPETEGRCSLILMVKIVKPPLVLDEFGFATGISRPPCFSSRISQNGRILHVDQNVTAILGYLPQDLVRTHFSDIVHQDDLPSVTEIHKKAFEDQISQVFSRPCRLRTQDGLFIQILSTWKSFRNPFSGEFQFFIVQHSVMKDERFQDQTQNEKLATLTQLLMSKETHGQ